MCVSGQAQVHCNVHIRSEKGKVFCDLHTNDNPRRLEVEEEVEIARTDLIEMVKIVLDVNSDI